jgi:SAM-dependent methyltransferase
MTAITSEQFDAVELAPPSRPAGSSWRRLGARFATWWHGYEAEPVGRIRKAPSLKAAGTDAAPRLIPISIAETMWGDGFAFPGSADLTLDLVKPLALSEKHSMLDLGCGLGAATRAIHEEFGSWMTGMDPCPVKAAAGLEISHRRRQERSAPITHIDFATPDLAPSRYDAVLSRLLVHRAADLQRFLGQITGAVRPGGMLLMFDFAKPHGRSTEPLAGAWRETEGCTHDPCTLEEYVGLLSGMSVDVRVAEDVTAMLVTHATLGLAELASKLEGRMVSADEMPQLCREIDLWGKRLAMLRSGELGIVRILGTKAGSPV